MKTKVEAQGGVYSIKNSINNKLYIGSTSNFKRRFKEHLKKLEHNKHHNILLQRFVNKYGISTIQFEILSEQIENRLVIEQRYLDTCEDLYNLSRLAGKVEMTEEVKKKIGEKTSKAVRTIEQKKHLSLINLGKKHSKETKEKLSLHMIKTRKSKDWPIFVGENNPNSKFTDIQVSNIKEMLHEGIKQSDIAKMFNVSKSCINKIFKNKSYKNIRHAY